MAAPTSLRDFYKNKNIFITGGTGFVGICLLEKILRTIPESGNIYLLLRPKRGKEISERLEDIKKNDIFKTVLKDKSEEQVFSKLRAVAGDVGQENLGLSQEDRKILTDNINVIIHSAASLDFGESLKTTVDINLLGTRRITELAKDCSNIAALVHVSSAYVNSWKLEAEEVIYPLPRDPEELINLAKNLDPKELEKKTPDLLGNHPNSYTITKHMAEHEIAKIEEKIPCAIVRPSMIVAAWKEPVPGWTISKNGPQGFFMAASKGVVRRLPVAKDLIYDYIPVDIVVNNLLTAGFYVGVDKPKKTSVYHCTSSTRNPFKWRMVEDNINVYLHSNPLVSAVWYPYLKLSPSILWFKISALFVHIFPALILDTVTRLSGGRPILMKLHRNINTSLDRLEKFIFTEWRFSAMKTMDLQDWLNKTDQEDFNLDIGGLDWDKLFYNMTLGARIYLSKDPIKTLKAAKRKDNILFGVHLLWQASLLSLLWFVFSCIIKSSMYSSAYILPILYALYNLL